jgi:hypothetical protein
MKLWTMRDSLRVSLDFHNETPVVGVIRVDDPTTQSRTDSARPSRPTDCHDDSAIVKFRFGTLLGAGSLGDIVPYVLQLNGTTIAVN